MTREPLATHRLGHISDSHFTSSGVLHDTVRPGETFAAALAALESSRVPIDALVHTGDIADAGEPAAYEAARAAADAVLARTGWPVGWAAGNHDVRRAMTRHLLGRPASDEPLDQVIDVRGLRLVLLDTSIPGRVEGAIEEDRLDRIRALLAEPAEHGTVVALHHPPVPVEVTGLQRLHLTGQDRLAAVLRGTDVRAVLGGHLHYATASVFAGIPVFVAPATAYVIRLTAPGGGVAATDGGRAVGVLSLYDDGRVGYSLLTTEPFADLGTAPDSTFETMGVDLPR
jgi:3',5'-cyclic AMP phosphodiesterase CpdA